MPKGYRIHPDVRSAIISDYYATDTPVPAIAAKHCLSPHQAYAIIRQCGLGKRSKFIDHTSERFGFLMVLTPLRQNKEQEVTWKCRCDCGVEREFTGTTLRRGKIVHCQYCKRDKNVLNQAREEVRSRYPKAAKLPQAVAGELPSSLWSRITSSATNRDIDLLITPEDAWEQFVLQERRCIYTGQELVLPKKWNDTNATASLDRIDSDLPYQKGNIAWIHKSIQRMKNDFSHYEFVSLCARITIHQAMNVEPLLAA